MVANSSTSNNDQPEFTIENNVLQGKVVPFKTPYKNVAKLVLDKLESNPDVVGQVDAVTDQKDSFSSMRDRLVRCAIWLKKYGIKTDDVVAVCAKNHLDSFIPCIAALSVGAIFNTWDPDMNVATARHFLKLTKPKVLFIDEGSVPPARDAVKIENHDLKIIVFGKYPGEKSFSDILREQTKSEVADFRCADVNDIYDTAAILYSSGTTGLPKGVQISHFALLYHVGHQEALNINEEVPLWFSRLYWISGVLLSFQSITSRTTRIVCEEFEEEFACKIIEKYKVTWILLSSSMANRLFRSGFVPKYDMSSLKCIFVGGSVFTQDSHMALKEILPHTKVLQAYGMTEVGGVITSQKNTNRYGTCGTLQKNIQLKIVDVETKETLGPNKNGEVFIKSPAMTRGYYNNPEATKETIDSEGWIHTGDLGYYNEEGELFILDRLKEIIKYRAHQISPAEVENVIQSHPAVLEAAVIGVPNTLDDEHPIAFVSKIRGMEVTEQEIIDLVANNMMDHQKLRAGVRFMESLPHTPSSKISRKELKAIANTLAK